jgi:hypothetical protein
VNENKVLRIIFGLKWEEMGGYWGSLQDHEFHNLYASAIIIRMIKSKRRRWVDMQNALER